MPRVLLTGMSATGKSTVLRELVLRGIRVVDADDEGWSMEVDAPDGSGVEQVWIENRMAALLEEPASDPVVVAGCASNQGHFYVEFDAVVLLRVPVDVMLQRLEARTTNDFGKRPGERERILADLELVEPVLRATATCELDGTRPVAELADEVEWLARGS